MMIVTPGVVLARKPFREFDRVAVIYTEALGKVTARFIGVDRPRGKLKAFAEPMVRADFRLYSRAQGGQVIVTGGALVETYASLRGRLDSTIQGLEICEYLLRLSPESLPSRETFDLVTRALSAVDENPSPWQPVSFGLRLLRLAGISLPPELAPQFDRLDRAPEGEQLFHIRTALENAMENHIERPLNVRLMRESLSAFAVPAHA